MLCLARFVQVELLGVKCIGRVHRTRVLFPKFGTHLLYFLIVLERKCFAMIAIYSVFWYVI